MQVYACISIVFNHILYFDIRFVIVSCIVCYYFSAVQQMGYTSLFLFRICLVVVVSPSHETQVFLYLLLIGCDHVFHTPIIRKLFL